MKFNEHIITYDTYSTHVSFPCLSFDLTTIWLYTFKISFLTSAILALYSIRTYHSINERINVVNF